MKLSKKGLIGIVVLIIGVVVVCVLVGKNPTILSHIDFNNSSASQENSPSNYSAKGNLDSIGCDMISGWSYDPDSEKDLTAVQIYYDGPAGSGRFLVDAWPHIVRQDVNSAFGIIGVHGFEISTPSIIKDGKPHTIYAYAVDSGVGHTLTELIGSPQNLQCAKNQSVTLPDPQKICPNIKTDSDWICVSGLGWLPLEHPILQQYSKQDLPTPNVITVYAKGVFAGGAWPHMVVMLGSKKLGEWDVKSSNWAEYQVVVNNKVNANLKVYFTNDYYNKKTGEDRNLFVDLINLSGRTYYSKSPKVQVSGHYISGKGCSSGILQTNELDCNNSYFEYPTKTGDKTSFGSEVSSWTANLLDAVF